MKCVVKAFLSALLCVSILLPFCSVPAAQAQEAASPAEANDITDYALVTESYGFSRLELAFDGKEHSRPKAEETAGITVSYSEGIGSIYLLFHMEYGAYTVVNNDTGAEHTCGEMEFLHDFLDLEAIFGSAPGSVTLRFDHGSVMLDDLYIFTTGTPPAFVQRWSPPAENQADMVLFSTHGDDEQLFFAGLLPYYANALDYRVQVVYLTDHRNMTGVRVHEMLNGLWAVGCTIYPVFGPYDDFKHDTMAETYRHFAARGATQEEMLGYVVNQIRRFKPYVAVGHDFKGEYGHGQHMVYADLLAKAIEITNDPSQYPESAEQYGVWDIPKTYIHLYKENPIVMDWDTPMEELNGMTPFEVTQKLGFPCHESQRDTFFPSWIYGGGRIVKATDIKHYSPCLYGLYRTTVGLDTGKNDMFENVIPYSRQPEPVPEETAPPETQPAPAEPAPTSPVADQPQQPAQDDTPLLIPIIAATALILIIAVVILFQTRKHKHSD